MSFVGGCRYPIGRTTGYALNLLPFHILTTNWQRICIGSGGTWSSPRLAGTAPQARLDGSVSVSLSAREFYEVAVGPTHAASCSHPRRATDAGVRVPAGGVTVPSRSRIQTRARSNEKESPSTVAAYSIMEANSIELMSGHRPRYRGRGRSAGMAATWRSARGEPGCRRPSRWYCARASVVTAVRRSRAPSMRT